MAKGNNNKTPNKNLLTQLNNLSTVTRSTNKRTYGMSSDINKLLTDRVEDFSNNLTKNINNDKSIINSNMTRKKLDSTKNKSQSSLYDIIGSEDILNSLQSSIGAENQKFSQLLKDYEVVKRSIPQVHKVITTLKNSIISPDALAHSAIGIQYPPNIDNSDKDTIDKLIDKFKMNERIQEYVMDYLISSVHYCAVVPYSMIPDMLTLDPKTVSETIELLTKDSGERKTLLNSTYGVMNSEIINESVNIEYYDKDQSISEYAINPSEYKTLLETQLNNIEIIDGGLEYFKKTILNEVTAEKFVTNTKSMKNIVNGMGGKLFSKTTTDYVYDDSYDGLLDPKKAEEISKKVDFKGCHIEDLSAPRVLPFKLRDTLIGYFYTEDNSNFNAPGNKNITSIMDKINSSVYNKYDSNITNQNNVEQSLIQSIGDRLIKSIDVKFLKDNYDDMDIIYEFVRNNELHTKNKRVTFFHPDDICAFVRKEGSIMKNCMFLAKIYTLVMLSNVIAKVTRGSDRNIYYVKTGLSTDIEGHVNNALRAIKQNQLRVSDFGTINEIFNLVGSNVDVFMPMSIDGEKPIEADVISGQNIDMNDDFISWLIRSIIQSFGVPASIVEDLESVDFAKTIAMNNVDMAKLVLDAQNEIADPLTQLFRLVIQYEMPEFDAVNEIFVNLTPPSIITFEMNRNRIESVNSMGDTLAALMVAPDGEQYQDKVVRLFKLGYFKDNIPNIPWPDIEKIYSNAKKDALIELTEDTINSNNRNVSDENTEGGTDESVDTDVSTSEEPSF